MSGAALSDAGNGHWRLAGALDFSSVPDVWPALERLLRGNADLDLSLAGVERTNSAGLVLLVEARAVAQRSGCRLHLSDIPAELLDLARISQCEALVAGDGG